MWHLDNYRIKKEFYFYSHVCVVHVCMKNVFLILPVWVPPSTSTFQHERIDQPSPTEVEVEYSTTYTSLQHPTTVLLFHVYHIYTQQLFNFQKIIFLLIPQDVRGPTTGLFVNV